MEQASRSLEPPRRPPGASAAIPREDQARIRSALGLSPREMEIALALMDGLSRAAVSRWLNSSQATVDTHIRRIFAKLDVRNVHGMVGKLFEAYLERRAAQEPGSTDKGNRHA